MQNERTGKQRIEKICSALLWPDTFAKRLPVDATFSIDGLNWCAAR